MTVILSISCSYQHQRQRDSKNRVIAEIADYWMAYQVVQEAFRENMGGQDKKTEKYLTVIKEKERITPGNLAKIFRVSGAAISGWASKSIQGGMIEWCDENGYHFVGWAGTLHGPSGAVALPSGWRPPFLRGEGES
jgi:hypothetical protein